MKNYYIILCLLTFLTSSSFAQKEFDKQIWKNKINGGEVLEVQDLVELASGNLAVLSVGDIGVSQLTLIKRTGETIRSINFNQKKSQLKSILELPNGQLMLSGFINVDKGKRNDGWLVLVSKHGDKIWEKQYGGDKDDAFSKIMLLDENNLILCGTRESKTGNKTDVWFVKINFEGTVVWEKEVGTKNDDVVNSLLKVDNGFVVAGQSSSSNNENAFIIKVNLEGNEDWREIFAEETNIANGIIAFDDKLIYVGYIFNEKGSIQRDVWAVKISPADGNVLWRESYPAVNDDIGKDLVELIDGKILMVGKSYSNATNSNFANTCHLVTNAHDGRTKEKIEYFDSKEENYATYVKYASNRDLMVAGLWDGTPFISRYSTITEKTPKIVLERYKEGEIKNITIGLNDDEANLDFEATIISPILIKKEDIKIYWNNQIQLNEKYYENIVLEKPYKSTENNDQFIYKFSNKIPITVQDTSVEVRLYNNLFSVKSGEYRFKLLRDFDIDIFWLSHVEGNYKKPLPKLVADNNMNIKLMIECTEELNKNDFEILINGKRTEGAKYGETIIDPQRILREKEKKENITRYQYTYLNNVYLNKGENKIKLQVRVHGKQYASQELVRVYNGTDEVAGYLQVDTTFNRNLTNLHVLAIGVEHSDLKYTVQDAKDIADAFKSLQGRGLFQQVNVETIVGAKANKTEIDIALERYKNAYRIGEITNKDVFVLFISSHGFIYKDSIAGATDWITFEKFLIQASNFDNAAKEATSVAYESIISTLAAIRCKKIVLIDACFSGGVNRNTVVSNTDNESINNLITQLSFQQPGLVTITSSTKSQPSYEDKVWGNGAFTEAIIDAFSNGDINGDKVVTLSEMYSHISKKIPAMVQEVKKQNQKPTITTDKLGNIPIYEME